MDINNYDCDHLKYWKRKNNYESCHQSVSESLINISRTSSCWLGDYTSTLRLDRLNNWSGYINIGYTGYFCS